MSKKYIITLVVATIIFGFSFTSRAGNPDRAGEAGAYELLMNPWAKSSGFMGMHSSRVEGVEAMRVNVAGLSFVKRTQVLFAHTQWLRQSGVSLNAAGIAQAFGKEKDNVIGVSIMSVSVGDIMRTTTTNPEGGIGTFKPTLVNIGMAYSRSFSSSIKGGFLVRLINERAENASASGVAIDLGIQYVTGKLDNIRFGIALRNVGTPMRFSGTGFTFRGNSPDNTFQQTISQRAEKFELPSLLNIGGSYDLYLDNMKNDTEIESKHRLTILANYTSNSFGKDQLGGGLEYGFKKLFMLRCGYAWENGLTKADNRSNAHTGFAAGVTVQTPLKKSGSTVMGIDYSYRTTDVFNGTHTLGVFVTL